MANISKYNRYSILFVDDEPKVRKYFELSFADKFNIISAESAEQALRILDSNAEDIALLLTDQRMPDKKGLELLKTVKQRYPQMIRILTTAYSDIGDAVESVNKGEVFRYILKPWDVGDLQEQLTTAIKLYVDKKEEIALLSQKKQAMFQAASSIAHELRTPLSGIYATVSGITEDLAELFRVYELMEQQSGEVKLSPSRRKAISKAFSNIEYQVKHSQTMISMLLENIRDESSRNTQLIESMGDCVQRAVESYPLYKHQVDQIVIDIRDDFSFYGNSIAITNVFHNIIKNGLYALQAKANADGRIVITVESSSANNHVCLRDQGIGIAPEVLPYIFDDFFTTKSNDVSSTASGNGIGLAFCKRVLNSWNAEIECYSELGDYTEFILTFPKTNHTENSARGTSPP